MMPDQMPADVKDLLERKRAWHRARAATPLQEGARPPGAAAAGSAAHRPPAPAPPLAAAAGRDAV